MNAIRTILSATVALTLAADALCQTKNATLLGRFNPGGRFNDVWGYRNPQTGKEYAILGSTTGTYILDVSNPARPVQRAFISASASGWRSSTWRDMKTYKTFCYVVTESGGGMQIIDLRNPDAPRLLKTFRVFGWGNSHNISIDEQKGVAYISGARGAGLWIINLEPDPTNPRLITRWSGSYVHDCTIQNGYAHLAQIFSRRYTILDVRNLPTIRQLGSVRDAGSIFCHNTWPTRDDNYCVTTNERGGGPVGVYDITNKNAPRLLATWHRGGSRVIPHNAMVRDRISHTSYYTQGVILLDVSNPRQPVEVGSYDTSTFSSGFNGAWGAYVQPESGITYVSDIQNGLYIVKAAGSVARYGRAAAGTGGRTPELHGFGAAWAGNASFAIEVENARPNSPGILIVSDRKASQTFAGLPINVSLGNVAIVDIATNSAGKARVNVPVPATVASGKIYAQAFVRDSGAGNLLRLAATKGLEIDVFRR